MFTLSSEEETDLIAADQSFEARAQKPESCTNLEAPRKPTDPGHGNET